MIKIFRAIVIVFIFMLLGSFLGYLVRQIYPAMGMQVSEDLLLMLVFYYFFYLFAFSGFHIAHAVFRGEKYLFFQSFFTGLFCFLLLFLYTSIYSGNFNLTQAIVVRLLPIGLLGFVYPFLRYGLRLFIK